MAFLALSRRAFHNLEKIETTSIEKWGQKVADAYIDSIEDALSLLQEHPHLLRTKNEISKHFSFYRVREHFLICAVIHKRIYVLAIQHATIDLPNRITELEPHLLNEAAILHHHCLKS